MGFFVGFEERWTSAIGHGDCEDGVAVVAVGDHDVGVARGGRDEELARLVGVNLAGDFCASQVDMIATRVRCRWLNVVWRFWRAGKLMGIRCLGLGLGFC